MAYIIENGREIWIPSLESMNDYISNPQCDEWKDPFSIYHYQVTYRWTHKDGRTGTRQIRVKHPSHAQALVNHWNQVGDDWTYEIEAK